jgi:hypothetical protein
MDNLNGLKKVYLDLANKELGIATNFLDPRIPSYNGGVGKHWVWISFSHVVSQIAELHAWQTIRFKLWQRPLSMTHT